MKKITTLLPVLAIVFGLAGSAQAYTFVTLDVPGATYTYARGINDSGETSCENTTSSWEYTTFTTASCINIPQGQFAANYPIINYIFPTGSEGTYEWYSVIVPCGFDVTNPANWLAN